MLIHFVDGGNELHIVRLSGGAHFLFILKNIEVSLYNDYRLLQGISFEFRENDVLLAVIWSSFGMLECQVSNNRWWPQRWPIPFRVFYPQECICFEEKSMSINLPSKLMIEKRK